LVLAFTVHCAIYDADLLSYARVEGGSGGSETSRLDPDSGSVSSSGSAGIFLRENDAREEPMDDSQEAPESDDSYPLEATTTEATVGDEVSVDAAPALPPPLLHYKFDETTGTVAHDSSGNARDGNISGTCQWVAGHAGNALSLDGSTCFVTVPSGIARAISNTSIVVWAEVDSSSNWQRIMDFGSSNMIYMFLTTRNSVSGTVRFAISKSGGPGEQLLDGPTALPVGAWSHVAVVLEGQRASLYVGGVLQSLKSTFSLRPSDLGSTTNDWLGRSQYATDPYFKGKLDDFRIYDYALSASQIAALAHL
jgi:hypothetical protein